VTEIELSRLFEEHRPRLRAIAYRMLGSSSDADDAVQEAWLRVDRADTGAVANLGGWLTTVVARICLDMLRARRLRREDSLEIRVPEPVIDPVDALDPEHETLLADAVGLALMVVLDALTPAERLAFVLHDMFAVPFDELAPIVGRTPVAARQLASRARRRVRSANVAPDPDLARQRAVVDAYLAAARRGDFEALLALLDPDVVLRADAGPGGASLLVRGARAAGERAFAYSRFAAFARPALVNGAAGAVAEVRGRRVAVLGFTVVGDRIVELNILADPARLRKTQVKP
jgi:RNA polymerase sigma-70 factor (ECF subfamily)